MKVWGLWLIYFIIGFCDSCNVLINEINTQNVCGSSNEFIEIIGHSCKPDTVSLRSYVILLATEHSKVTNGPAVILSADLRNHKFKFDSNRNDQYFVIGKKNDYDMNFEDNMLGFIPKTKPISCFFSKSGTVDDVIDDGVKYSNALILLKCDRRSPEINSQLNALKIRYRDENSHVQQKNAHIPIDDGQIAFIKKHSVDMLIFSQKSEFSESAFFKSILPDEISSKFDDFDLRPGFEWNSKKKDKSLSRCRKHHELSTGFQFNRFKLADISPGEPNHCEDAINYVLVDRNLPEVLNENESMNVDEAVNTEESNSENSFEVDNNANFDREEERLRRKRRRQSNVIDADVQFIDENTPSQPKYPKDEDFYKAVSEAATKMVSDLKISLFEAFGLNTNTCALDEKPVHPWEDSSMWSKADESAMKRAFQSKFKLTDMQKAWLKFIPTDDPENPRFACRFCREHWLHNQQIPLEKYGDFAKQDGAFYDPSTSKQDKLTFWRTKIRDHEKPHLPGKKTLRTHASVVLDMQKGYENKNKECLDNVAGNYGQEKVATSRVIRTAYTVVKRHISFRIFPDVIQLLKFSEALPKNVKHANRRSLGRMINVISRQFRASLINTIKTEKPPITIILDSSSDHQSRQYLLIYIQFTYDLTPFIHLYRVVQLTSETGEAMKQVLLECFRNDSITNEVKENLIGFTSDGAASNVGVNIGLGTLLEQWIREEPVTLGRRSPIFRVHCASHRLQLALQRVVKGNLPFKTLHYRFQSTVNGLYSFYNAHSVKRTSSLKQFATTWKTKVYHMKAIIQIRWVSSQFSAISILKRNYYVYLHHLQHIINSGDFDISTNALAAGYYNEIITLDFHIYMLFVLDTLRPLKILNEKLQKNLYSITELHADLEDTLARFDQLKNNYGHEITNFLTIAECRKQGEVVDCSIELFNEDDETLEISIPMLHYYPVISPQEKVIFKRRRNRLNLNVFRDYVIPALISDLKNKFPESPNLMHQLGALEPEALPFGLQTLEAYAQKLKPLVARFGGADELIMAEFVDILKYVLRHDEQNYLLQKQSAMSKFWAYAIKYANEHGKVEVGEFKTFISKIMATSMGSSVVERGFSSFFYSKSSRRSRLSTTTLQDIMNIMINGPEPEAFNPFPATAAWLAEGHRTSDSYSSLDPNTHLPAAPLPNSNNIGESDMLEIDLDEDEIENDSEVIDDVEEPLLSAFIDDISEEDPIFPEDNV